MAVAGQNPPARRHKPPGHVFGTGGTTAVIDYTPEACARRLAEALGARSIPISAPAILSSPEAKMMLLNEPVVAEQIATFDQLDRIICGVSSLRANSTIHSSGFFDSALQQHDHYHNAVGSIAGRFIDAHGQQVDGPLTNRTLGIELSQLCKVPTRVLVAGGYDKVQAILAALRGGYVGRGLADAVAVGNVFASPPPDRVLTCTRSASTGAGVLYIYGNYTGDVMNFDMAAELAAGEGIEVRTILTTDDVASSAAEDRAGRRGTAGNVFVFKIAGAACDRMYPLDECERLARKANAATFTMGLGLEPCSLPETQRPSFRLGENDMEVGIGIHGEPGVTRQPLESADAAADRIFDRLMAEMQLAAGARVALLVNSLGGTPMMELFILNRRIQQRLVARNITISRCLVGHYCTSLDMVGASITLMRLDDELLDLFDHPCAGFAWPNFPPQARANLHG